MSEEADSSTGPALEAAVDHSLSDAGAENRHADDKEDVAKPGVKISSTEAERSELDLTANPVASEEISLPAAPSTLLIPEIASLPSEEAHGSVEHAGGKYRNLGVTSEGHDLYQDAPSVDIADFGADVDETSSQSPHLMSDQLLERIAVDRTFRSDIVTTAARYLFRHKYHMNDSWKMAYQLEIDWQERLASTEQAPAQIQQQQFFVEDMRFHRRLIERLEARLNTPPLLLPLASKRLVAARDAVEILVAYLSLLENGRKIGEVFVSQMGSRWHKTDGTSEVDGQSVTLDTSDEGELEPKPRSMDRTSAARGQTSHKKQTEREASTSEGFSAFERNIAAAFSRFGLSLADPVSQSKIPQNEEQHPDLAKVGDGQESSAAPPDIYVTDADEEAELEQDLVRIKEALSHYPAFRSELVTELHQILSEEQDPERMERTELIEKFLGQWVDADLSLMHEAKAETIRIVMTAAQRRAELFSKIKAWFAANPDAISRAASNQVVFEEAVELVEIHAELASVGRKIYRCITTFMEVEKAREEMIDVGDQGGEPLSQAGVEKDAE